jgi:hypothetical protein
VCYPTYPSSAYNYYNLYDTGLNVGNFPVNNNPPAPPVVPIAPIPEPPPLPPVPDAASISAQLENAINGTPEMIAANKVARKAQAMLTLAKAAVIDGLRNREDYRKAIQNRDAAEQQLDAAKESAGDPKFLNALAQTKMHAGEEVTRLEEKAINADPAASAAKKQLDDAISKSEALHSTLLAKFQAGPS